ncbi:uncharacterized protein ATNIH1004_002323 [Aspergillus tanneri]|uniref:Ferric oxidoreductase domain-containing protein n=1 Tax=Aspergillus tanneri TaxID=1220188 RepID=A0A5M9MRB2_9EURO|nr:uncharacterized protein ATNIH1004_002323 [Aspergillus tanneri]KAA8649652.1 hypothetical protein ATNIH1004_002323 [Aspergillus tanneri]
MAINQFNIATKSVEKIYTAVVGGVISILVFYNIFSRMHTRFSGSHRLATFMYPVPFRTYLVGNGACNFIGVQSLSEAGSRAARLSLINLIPMFISGGYEFGARLLGVSLQTYGAFHRMVGLVAVIEATIHVLIIAQTRSISTSNTMQVYGVLV